MGRRWIPLLLVGLGSGVSLACGPATSASRGYRELPPMCVPCGDSNLVVASAASIARIHADLVRVCGESQSPDAWREQVERAGIDFEKEALVLLYDVIGTGGTARLEVEGPIGGALEAAIEWETPPGPARPIATAVCFSLGVDRSLVRRVELATGRALDRGGPGARLTLEIPR